MFTVKSFLAVLMFISAFTNVCARSLDIGCGSGCECMSRYVTCSDITSFPDSFPKDTVSIELRNIYVDTFPVGVFANLLDLAIIKVNSSAFSSIPEGAFNSLNVLDVLSFDNVDIGVIESYAFHNISEVGQFSFTETTIRTIEPFGFSEFYAFDELTISMSSIETVASKAFNNIDEVYKLNMVGNAVGHMESYGFSNVTNVIFVRITDNVFGELSCGNFGQVLEYSYKTYIASNSVPCSCHLIWTIQHGNLMYHTVPNACIHQKTKTIMSWYDYLNSDHGCDNIFYKKEACDELLESIFETQSTVKELSVEAAIDADSERSTSMKETTTSSSLSLTKSSDPLTADTDIHSISSSLSTFSSSAVSSLPTVSPASSEIFGNAIFTSTGSTLYEVHSEKTDSEVPKEKLIILSKGTENRGHGYIFMEGIVPNRHVDRNNINTHDGKKYGVTKYSKHSNTIKESNKIENNLFPSNRELDQAQDGMMLNNVQLDDKHLQTNTIHETSFDESKDTISENDVNHEFGSKIENNYPSRENRKRVTDGYKQVKTTRQPSTATFTNPRTTMRPHYKAERTEQSDFDKDRTITHTITPSKRVKTKRTHHVSEHDIQVDTKLKIHKPAYTLTQMIIQPSTGQPKTVAYKEPNNQPAQSVSYAGNHSAINGANENKEHRLFMILVTVASVVKYVCGF